MMPRPPRVAVAGTPAEAEPRLPAGALTRPPRGAEAKVLSESTSKMGF